MIEKVLVVRLEDVAHLFKEEFGFVSHDDYPNLYHELKIKSFFVDRGPAELDNSIRQLIPYANVRFGDDIFVTERTKKQTESRLHNKLSIGLGGHINPVDLSTKGDIIELGLLRELEEEIYFDAIDRINFRGYIYDNSSSVGLVHLGLLYEVWLTNSNAQVKEVDKMNGWWCNVDELTQFDERLETWSKIANSQITRNEMRI